MKKKFKDLNFSDFSKFFNKDFWKAFKNKVLFYWDFDLTTEKKKEILEQLFTDLKNKNYYPSIPRTYIYKEKSNFISRIIPVFEIKDYCLYYFCIKQLEEKIAENRVPNTFWWWSLWWQIRKKEDDEIELLTKIQNENEEQFANFLWISISEYSFNPFAWSRAYRDFWSKLKSTIESWNFQYCVEFDIANFYDNIKLDILERYIYEITDSKDYEIVSILFHFLYFWNRKFHFYSKSNTWLSQDALNDCSRILANFYLQKYDEYVFNICGENFKYFRYADDQFIFWENKEDLQEKILQVSIFLNSIWLSINPKKIKFHTIDELYIERSFKLFDLVAPENTNPQNIKIFIEEICKIFKNKTNECLKNWWISLLNKAIYLDFENIDLEEKVYIKSLFLEEKFLKQCSSDKFEKIYNFLEKNEQGQFIEKLLKISENYKYNDFHYSVLLFFQNFWFNDEEKILKNNMDLLENYYKNIL